MKKGIRANKTTRAYRKMKRKIARASRKRNRIK